MGRTPAGQTREKIYRFMRERLLEGRPPTVREVQQGGVEDDTNLSVAVAFGLATRIGSAGPSAFVEVGVQTIRFGEEASADPVMLPIHVGVSF